MYALWSDLIFKVYHFCIRRVVDLRKVDRAVRTKMPLSYDEVTRWYESNLTNIEESIDIQDTKFSSSILTNQYNLAMQI